MAQTSYTDIDTSYRVNRITRIPARVANRIKTARITAVQTAASPLQGPRPPPEGEGYGCQDSDQECWAGVYFDSATKEVLHLEAGGQAFLSPGTAAPAAPNARGGCFWWKAEQAELHLVGCLDQRPFTWPGAGGNLRRDPPQAGKMVGFGAEWRTGDDDEAPEEASESPGNPSRVDGMVVRVARDPLGFLFPGSMYEMLLRPGAGCGTRYSRRYRGVLNRDGTVTDGASGRRVATWSFPETRVLPGGGGGSWATGDAIVLRVETDHYQVNLMLLSTRHMVDVTTW